MVCNDCGLVQSDTPIDYGKDNRVFADGDGMQGERWGAPKSDLIHDGGLSTDVHGKTVMLWAHRCPKTWR